MFDSFDDYDMDADWMDRDPLADKADYDIHEERELDFDMQMEDGFDWRSSFED